MPLHTCNDGCSPGGHAQTVRAHQHFTVDLHAHILTPAVESLVADCQQKKGEPDLMRHPMGWASALYNAQRMLPEAFRKMTSLDERLRDLDAMGIDVQVLSPSPNQYYYWAGPELAGEIVRVQNEHIAEVCSFHPRRLVGFGT